MRKAMLLGAALFLGLIILLPTATLAAPSKIVASTGVPVKVFGDASYASRAGTLVLEPGPETRITLTVRGALLEIIQVHSSYANPAPGIEALGERRIERTTVPLPDGPVHVAPETASALLAFHGRGLNLATSQPTGPQPPADLWTDARSQLSLLFTPLTLQPPVPELKLLQADTATWDAVQPPLGSYVAEARAAQATVQTLDGALLYAVELAAGPALANVYTSTTRASDVAGSVYTPHPDGAQWTGPGTHREETLTYFRLSTTGGTLQGTGTNARLVAPDLLASATGYVGLPWAQGSIHAGNHTTSLQGQQAVLGGELRLRPIGHSLQGAPRITLLGDGDIRFIQVGTATHLLPVQEAALVATGAAVGLGVAALLVYFWPVVKYAASIALFPLYARVPKERTLDHAGREHLYDLIKGEPGISTNKLAQEVPFGWSTLTYHLRVLERNEAIVSVRDGRYKRFFDRQSGRFSNGRKYVLAVLKNDATLAIARHIRAHPGTHQKDVAETFQLSPSSVHWHVERLQEVGLVQKQRDAHHIRYYPAEGWSHVSDDDLQTLGPSAAAAPTSGPSGPAAPSTAP